MTKKSIKIVQLYPRDMNIYGDWGNVLVLKKRLQWYGYEPVVVQYNPGDDFPQDVDIVVGGGGQDSGQQKIQSDLLKIGPKLQNLAQADTPMLVICGLYQLFGNFFKTLEGETIQGIGLLDIETYGKTERLIGNITTTSEQFGQIIGYENHSGQTFLGQSMQPLGKVVVGAGNNLTDGHEGVIFRNVIGSYMHGSLLPKNPQIADYLIEKAVIKKYGSFEPAHVIDDSLSSKAREVAFKRPR